MCQVHKKTVVISLFNDILFSRNKYHYVPSALGARRTSKFTVVSHHPNVSRRPHLCPRPCLFPTLFTQYFLQFFVDGFQIHRYGDYGKDLELIMFCDLGSIFKVTRDHYVSKLTLFTQFFLRFLLLMAFKFSEMVTMDATLN